MAEPVRLAHASRVFVAGHRGLVGSAIVRRLEALGCRNVVRRRHSELDLCDQAAVNKFFLEHRVGLNREIIVQELCGGDLSLPESHRLLLLTRTRTRVGD